ncbi:MAG: hypothetical protein ABI690_10170 [Chloroflexota bacterium]
MLIGRTQPPPALIRQLHLTDCAMPCWIGITPGTTQAESVNRFVMDTFKSTNSPLSSAVPNYQWFTIVPLTQPAQRGQGMPVQFGVNEGTVTEILIPAFFSTMKNPGAAMPSLGDMVNLLGVPTCVGSTSLPMSNSYSLFYEYEGTLLEIGLFDYRDTSWAQPIYFLSIRRSDLFNRVNGCQWENVTLPAWTGLKNARRYLDRIT